MRYIGPKFKLCRREQKNLFGSEKYAIGKGVNLPGPSGTNMSRLSEYGKLLRNKQVLKRIYGLSERQFFNLVNVTSQQYAKNKGQSHDKMVLQFLERRLDSVILKAGLAQTIMQARQMISHSHRLLNDKKHNVPSYFMKAGDVLKLRPSLHDSNLYNQLGNRPAPTWIKFDKNNYTVELLQLPDVNTIEAPVDLLKVVEYYARA